jgi:peptide/nickel transport system substrate-binding protein
LSLYSKARVARGLAALAAVSAATAAVAVSTSSAASGRPATAGGVYTLALSPPQGAINPLVTADLNAMYIVGLANAQLVNESDTGALVPQLARSWSVSNNGLQWTFNLREAAKFSDGVNVTPDDVIYTFDNIIAPKSLSPAKSSFAGILSSVAQGPTNNSVVFTLSKPYSDFPYLLTGANTYVLPAGTVPADWVKDPIGAGQFILTKYTPGQSATFKKNPYYWDASAVKLSGVDAKFFSDSQSELLAFKSGEIDQINPVDVGASVLQALGKTAHRTVTAGYAKFDGIVFNVNDAPFNNVKVRQAVAWALNRSQIVKTVYSGDATVGNDLATFPDYGVQPQGVSHRNANAAKVKQLLAGVTTPITFTITTYQPGESVLAQLIQQQLDATGDFSVQLKLLTEAAYYASGAGTPWLTAPVTITDWADRLPTQLEGLLYAKGSSWNASKYANPTLDKLASEYESKTSTVNKQRIASQIGAIEWNDVPVIIPAFEKNTLIVSPKVAGDFPNGQNFSGGFDLRGVSL